MKLYYSGASAFLGVQNKASLSLGGFISNTPIPNSLPGNIFGDISLFTIERKLIEYRLIVLKNELIPLTDILLYFLYPATYPFVKYEIAAVNPNISGSEYYFETIENIYSAPLYVNTWYEADGIANQLNLGDLLVGAYLGIWIKRTILPIVDTYFTEEAIIANYKLENPIVLPKTDLTQLKLSWSS